MAPRHILKVNKTEECENDSCSPTAFHEHLSTKQKLDTPERLAPEGQGDETQTIFLREI